jgi:hypothetical protein
VCPASEAAVSEIVVSAEQLSAPPAYPLAIPDATAIQSADHAAWLYHRIRVVESVTENIRKALEDWVDPRPPSRWASGGRAMSS